MVWWEKAMVGSKGKLWECGLVGKSDVWVKGKATGVWSGKGKSDVWVKGKGIEVWSDKKKRRLGQRESPRSVAWWEKTPPGSKGKASKCGLVGKSDGWVKGKGIEVWSDKKNRR